MTRENGRAREEFFHDVVLNSTDEDDNVLEADQDGLSSYAFRPYVSLSPQYVSKKGWARYKAALKHLAPFRKKEKKKNVIPVDSAGFFSFMTFSWLSNYVYLAHKKGLTFENVPLCSPYDSCDLNAQRLGLLWKAELDRRGPENASFARAAWKFMRTRFILSCFVYVVSCMLGFLSPAIFMRKLLEYCQDPEASTFDGLIWAFAFTLSELVKMLMLAFSYGISYRTGIRLRAACLVLVYKKLTRIQSLGPKSIGEIINLYGSDASRLSNMVIFAPLVFGGPIVVVCCGIYIYLVLGLWALLGLSAFILSYPLQYLLSRLNGYFREMTIRKTDERIRLITEILNTIKLIKMYSWDSCFMRRIQDIREEELNQLEKADYCQSIGISLAPTVPVISGILTFIIHVATGGNLNAAQAFPTLSVLLSCISWKMDEVRRRSIDLLMGYESFPRFKAYPLVSLLNSQLRGSLLNLRYGSENIIDGHNSFARIQEVLMLEEIEPYITYLADRSISVSVSDGVFTWSDHPKDRPRNKKAAKGKGSKKSEGGTHGVDGGGGGGGDEKEKLTAHKGTQPFRLESINLCVSKGLLVGICGTVGSGKSSLLQACLGQMKKVSGQISKSGRSAYVSQEAWIENTTLKNNILFGEPFDPKKYINALYCCALNEDVNFLPAGDETEIGERGVNLSGGQKQRVSLARAVYANREIYFLDDPLSAVDSQVASHIFEKCILGALSKKTVFLVTHQTRFLQKCDEILVMKEGKIVERGTHHELLSKEREYSYMVESSTLISLQSTLEGADEKKEDVEETDTTKMVAQHQNSISVKFTSSEEQVKGGVRPFAYKAYIKAAGGYFLCIVVFMSIFVNVGSTAFSSWWLAVWLKAGSGNATIVDPATNETVVSPYINDNPDLDFYMQVYGGIIGVICLTSLIRGITFTKVTIRASRVFHQNILGKLINSRLRHFEVTPIGRIQNIFSRDLSEIDSRLPGAMETLIQNLWTVAFAFLLITLVFPWFIVALVVLAVFYYLIAKLFRTAVRDLKRIEGICRTPIFSALSATISGLPIIHAFNKENDYLSRFYKMFDENSVCTYMTCCAMRWLAIRLDSISVMIALTTSILVVFLKGEVAPAFAGLALTYSAHISGIFQYTLRLMTETEGRFIAVERMLLNVQKLEIEANPKGTIEVSPNWPACGSIKFQNVHLSYSVDLPSVLNGITLTVKAGEKIGVVGRTGAGKSSLVAAMFRLVELSEGAIFIDDVDIAYVPLSILRGRLSVIPQDPVVFSGTLRSNLDPFNKYSDNIIWDALKQTKLITKVQSMAHGLSTLVGEGGENLSVGESQLLCLARALLRGSKILILDEATASVDPDTETAVQTTIEENFGHCTIITIAHRLKTVTNCEKVLVVHQGMVQEYDDPNKLLENPNSFFSRMTNALK